MSYIFSVCDYSISGYQIACVLEFLVRIVSIYLITYQLWHKSRYNYSHAWPFFKSNASKTR